MRVKTVLLLLDGYDNDYYAEEIFDEVKKILKAKIYHSLLIHLDLEMIMILNWWVSFVIIKYETFFSVETFEKIQDYFVNALVWWMNIVYYKI